jgi:hypothetical protein
VGVLRRIVPFICSEGNTKEVVPFIITNCGTLKGVTPPYYQQIRLLSADLWVCEVHFTLLVVRGVFEGGHTLGCCLWGFLKEVVSSILGRGHIKKGWCPPLVVCGVL